jgi:hypothetical protein
MPTDKTTNPGTRGCQPRARRCGSGGRSRTSVEPPPCPALMNAASAARSVWGGWCGYGGERRLPRVFPGRSVVVKRR